MTSEPMVFNCDGCMAFKRNPDDESVGECRRHAPSPMVIHVKEPPEVEDDGRLKGGRLTIWPGVVADESCCEFIPNATTLARAQAIVDAKAAKDAKKH